MSYLSGLTSDDSRSSNFLVREENEDQLGPVSVVPIDNKSCLSKKWHVAALMIGALVVGVGGLGTVGLLQSYGIISLPQSLQWLASAIGTIGHTPHFWSLWVLAGSGLAVGTSLIAFAIYKIKKPTALALKLDGVPQSSDKAHRITWTLKAPLNFCIKTAISLIYPLQGSTKQKVSAVAKKIFNALAVILVSIPACALYGLGAINSKIFDTPRIDTSMLHIAPQPLDTLVEDLDHDLAILERWFAEECPSERYQDGFNRMIQNIKERNQALINAHQHLPPSFYDDMTLYLKNIINILQKSPERKKDVLIALAEAADVCPPTWYETAKKQLQLLVNPNVGEVQLLHWIQDIKEEIILNFAQNTFDSQWHAINLYN